MTSLRGTSIFTCLSAFYDFHLFFRLQCSALGRNFSFFLISKLGQDSRPNSTLWFKSLTPDTFLSNSDNIGRISMICCTADTRNLMSIYLFWAFVKFIFKKFKS